MAMRSDTSYRKTVLCLAGLLLAFLPVAAAQPTITSIQAGTGEQPPKNVQGITSGTYLEAGLTLYVHGVFNDSETVMWWCNTATEETDGCVAIYSSYYTPTEMRFNIPAYLYCELVDIPQTVEITVGVADGGSSAPAEFTIYPPLSPITPLPIATVGVPYSGAMVTGGTPPYIIASVTGSVPPGLTAGGGDQNQFLVGTPTSTGAYNFTPMIEDQWGNSVNSCLTVQVIANAALTSLSPMSAPAGSPGLTLTINGSNFLDPESPVGASQVQWTFNNQTTFLATTYVSSTQLQAVVPQSLLLVPGAASVAVLQPNDLVSAPLTFTIASPSITSLSPPSAVAGSGPVNLTVVGANFAPPSNYGSPSVVFGSTPLTTTYVDSGHLTVQIPANLLTTPGVNPVSVINPGAAFSNSVNFTVNSNLSITIVTLPQATAGTPYQTHLTGSGGQGTLTWSATGLPPGLTITGQGLIAGTPTTAGTYSVVARLMDSTEYSVQSTLSLIVNPSLSITTTGLPQGTVGTVYQTQLAGSGGQGTRTWSATGLPPGLTISPQGAITGTPTTAGTFSVVARLTDAISSTVQTTLPLVVNPALSITTTTLPPATAGTSYQTHLTGSGGQGTLTWSATGLPAGLTISPQGVIAGTPTSAGTYSVAARLTDANSSSVQATLSLTVNSGLSITTTTLPPATVGTPYQTALATTGGQGTLTWSATGLPVGLSISSQGRITGTASNTGTYSVTIRVMDSTEFSVQATLSLSVVSSLSITTTTLPPGTVGVPYQTHLNYSGGQGTITWSANNLPAGFTISGHGDLTGTPATVGTFPVAVRVTDGGSNTVQATLSLNILPDSPTITTPSTLPNGTVGKPYLTSITVTGDGPYEFSLTSGALPDGLSLSKSGGISGTPTKAATFNFVITAKDPNGNAPGKGFTLAIAPTALTIPGDTSPAPVGTTVSFNLAATGGAPPYRYTLGCALPAGLSFSNGTISGTPTTPGTTSCRLVVVDSLAASASKDFTIAITQAAFALPGGPLPDGQTGVAYTAQIAAAGGIAPITYSATGIPDGLTFSNAGAITGTPTTAGTFTIAATATDATGAKATASYTLTIGTGKLTVTTKTLPAGTAGSSYSAMLNAIGGVKPYSWTVANLPSGLTAMPEGVISGTPAAPGAVTVNVTVKDAADTSASASFNLTINAGALVISTDALPNGTVGVPYSATLAATGGQGGLTWSAVGLPAGLTMSSSGVLSGTVTAPVTATVTVEVADSSGASVHKALALTIALPANPSVSFAGIGSISNPLQQPALGISLGSVYPVDVVVTLTLTFQADSGADDPTIVFSNGTRTTTITVPAGSTIGASQVGVQTGSVAGLITITAHLQAAGQDVTPQPAPQSTIRINPAVPLISSVTATRSATGLTVTIAGLATTREITQAVFQFNAAPGSNLETTSLTIAVDSLFSAYFGSPSASPFGSQFVFSQPFNVTGSTQSIASVTVTLTNKQGTSTAVTANVN